MTSQLKQATRFSGGELNIIVFGESGVGKSALINQVYDRPVVKSSSQAIGCTVENIKVSGTIQDRPDLSFNIYDTVGLSESADGSIPTVTAFIQLIKLAYAVPNGINLLICCAEKGRLSSERFKANYRILKEELCENRIPCLLVITKCDGDDPIDDWWFENEATVRNKLRFDFVDGVCVSTVKTKKKDPNRILEDYKVSRQNLVAAIVKHALTKPTSIDSWSRKVIVAARSFYNGFAKWLSWLRLQQAPLRPELVQMFIELSYSQDAAYEEAEKLLSELSQEDLLAPYHEVCA